MLNEGQKEVLEAVKRGENVFITGSAGVGKSYLIREITGYLSSASKVYTLLAPTGVAAVNIGGQTIHRFAHLKEDIKTLADYIRIMFRRVRRGKWATLNVIIIDEISMVHPDLFDLVEQIARLHRSSFGHLPFGGLQVILIGDFYQLPYVPNKDDREKRYIFQTDLWRRLNLQEYELSLVMRQKDAPFIEALNDLRKGHLSETLKDMLLKCAANTKEPGVPYVKLCALNSQKTLENEAKLKRLQGEACLYKAADWGDERFLKGCRAEKELLLKVGAPVMLLWNLPEHDLCNGSVGIVKDIKKGYPLVKFNAGPEIVISPKTWTVSQRTQGKLEKLATRMQIPLAVAYSISQHKSQGLTLDYLEVDCSGIFTTGQLYTALSRASSPKGLIIRNFEPSSIMVDEAIDNFYKDLRARLARPDIDNGP